MIAKLFQKDNFVNVSVVCTDATGARTNPTAATATFYRVSPVDGSLDSSVDGDPGTVTLTQINSETGFYGASVDISDITFGTNASGEDVRSVMFSVLFELTISGITTGTTDSIIVEKNVDMGGAWPGITVTVGVQPNEAN